jgi:hypothetical protein
VGACPVGAFGPPGGLICRHLCACLAAVHSLGGCRRDGCCGTVVVLSRVLWLVGPEPGCRAGIVVAPGPLYVANWHAVDECLTSAGPGGIEWSGRADDRNAVTAGGGSRHPLNATRSSRGAVTPVSPTSRCRGIPQPATPSPRLWGGGGASSLFRHGRKPRCRGG